MRISDWSSDVCSSDLGPLVSRERLARGELQQIVRELAQREYDIPGSRRRHLGEKTIEGWFSAYRRQGIEGLLPKPRSDRGQCKLPLAVQQAIVRAAERRVGTGGVSTLCYRGFHY